MRIKESTILTAIYLLGVVLFLYFGVYYINDHRGHNVGFFSLYSTIGILFLEGIIARVGFIVAKEKGEDPIKWAKHCFILNVWALIYLHSMKTKKTE